MKKRGRYRCKEKCTIHFSAGGKKYYKPKKKPVYHKERQAKYMRKMSRRKQYIPKMIHYLIFLKEGIDINNWTSTCQICGNKMDVSSSKVNFKLKKLYCSKKCISKSEPFKESMRKHSSKKYFINKFINRLAYLNGTSTNKHQYASVAKKIKKIEEKNKTKYVFCRVCGNLYCREVFGGGTAFCSKPCENAYDSARSCRIKKRMPKWITVDQISQMALMHLNCPESDDVDHIVPLKHEKVSGLHVPWNLQHLEHEENVKKGNSFES